MAGVMERLSGSLEQVLMALWASIRARPETFDFAGKAHGQRGWAMRSGRGASLSENWWRRHPGARLARTAPRAPRAPRGRT